MSRLAAAGFAKVTKGLLEPRPPVGRPAGVEMQRQQWFRAALGGGALIFVLAGCAPRASQIAPALMDPFAYEAATCRELDEMRAKAQRDRIYADIAQDQQHDDDRTRTFGVPTPMATLFEESRAPSTARMKADSLVINAQLERSGCLAFNNTGIVPMPKY